MIDKHGRVLPLMPLYDPDTFVERPRPPPYKSSREGMVCLSTLSQEDKRAAWAHIQVHEPVLMKTLRGEPGGDPTMQSLMSVFPGCAVWVERERTGLPPPQMPGATT